MDNEFVYECQVPEISSVLEEEEEREAQEFDEARDYMRLINQAVQGALQQVHDITNNKRELEDKIRDENRYIAICEKLIAAENEEGDCALKNMLRTLAEVCKWEKYLASKSVDLERTMQINFATKNRNDKIMALVEEERLVRRELAKYNVLVIDEPQKLT